MDPLDAAALAGIALVAVVLILEAGHFTARTIHARNAAKRQMDLARQVQEALASTSAIVAREPEAAAAEIVVEATPRAGVGAVDLEEPVAAQSAEEPSAPRRRRAAATAARAAPSSYFPLTEPQRRLLQELALGRTPPLGGDRLGTDLMLEWLATLGFVQHGEGEGDYAITAMGRQVLGGTP